ncbi:MAG: hypothetical protein ACYC9L_13245 [Sulfuricaulis sp.]
MKSTEPDIEAIVLEAEVAGLAAAAACVPVPMFVEGIRYDDGQCGTAYFIFDGRGRFGRWYRRRHPSDRNTSRFYAQLAGQQSADRLTAYLIAFRAHLGKHGIAVGQVVRELD